jgi:ABC-type phosphate transport system substrate-binding protein
VVLQYTSQETTEQALATFAAGSADFVSLDSAISQELLPSGMVQVPLAGVALVVAYNLPNINYQLVHLRYRRSRCVWLGVHVVGS